MNKVEFYQSIDQNTAFDECFFKKVYGYSVCDDTFITSVQQKLMELNLSDIIQQYNEWFAAWKSKYDTEMEKVAESYSGRLKEEYDRRNKSGKSYSGSKHRFNGFSQVKKKQE